MYSIIKNVDSPDRRKTVKCRRSRTDCLDVSYISEYKSLIPPGKEKQSKRGHGREEGRSREVQRQDSWKVFQLKYSLSGRTIGRLSTRTVCSVSLTLFQSGYSGPSENGEKRKPERGREGEEEREREWGRSGDKEKGVESGFTIFLGRSHKLSAGMTTVQTFPLPPWRWLVNVSIPIGDRFADRVSRDHR